MLNTLQRAQPDTIGERTATMASPETPQKSKRGFTLFLDEICHKLEIALPYSRTDEAMESPSASRRSVAHEVISHLRFLYFQDRSRLDAVIEEFVTYKRQDILEEVTTQSLKDCLAPAVAIAKQHLSSPLSASRQTRSSWKGASDDKDSILMPPPSPSLGIKHAPRPELTATSCAGHWPPDKESDFVCRKISFTSSAATSCTTDMTTSFMTDSTSNPIPDTPLTELSEVDVGASQEPEFFATPITPSLADHLEAAIGKQQRINEHYRVARIPSDGMVQQDLPSALVSELETIDLCVEAYRVMRACSLEPERLEAVWQRPRTFTSLHKLLPKFPSGKRFQKGFKMDFSRQHLNAKLCWSKDGPLLQAELGPPATDMSTALQRRFGADRFLTVEMPSLMAVPECIKGQDVEFRVCEMLGNDQNFFGRCWVPFLVKAKKQRKANGSINESGSSHELVLFAVSGKDISPVGITELLNWAVPLYENRDQPACKAFARLDLAQSRSRPALEFEMSGVLLGEPDLEGIRHGLQDRLATDESDDHSFQDPDLDFLEHYDPSQVMDDGCAEISIAAMQSVRNKLGLEYLPSVVQGRINTAKGVWYRSSGTVKQDWKPEEVWIKIHQSQVKAKHTTHSLQGDAGLRTFNLVNHSRPACSSLLYPGFMPILRDRGVPEDAILDLARRQIDLDIKAYLNALHDPAAIHRWIHDHGQIMEQRSRDSDTIQNIAGFPSSPKERAVQLLEAGFRPEKCSYLRTQVMKVADKVFELKAKQFKVRLGKSTSLIGIADPTGLLAPGEIAVSFSKQIEDPETREAWSLLDGEDVLVARNPSMRNADIQRVRTKYVQELKHLRDVVIFSSRGRQPLASKLSGGDYDGDTFWVCWQPMLVNPFCNAPAPKELEPIETFGISQDIVKLGDVLCFQSDHTCTELSARKWIQRSIKARLRDSNLGQMTLQHQRFTYRQGSISEPRALLMVDAHDHLADADKKGYLYTSEAFKDFLDRHKIPRNLPEPTHRKYTSRDYIRNPAKFDNCKPNRGDVVDQLYFSVLVPSIKKAREEAIGIMQDCTSLDEEVTSVYHSVTQSLEPGSVLHDEFKRLSKEINYLYTSWSAGMQKYHKGTKGKRQAAFDAVIDPLRSAYLNIQPINISDPAVQEWTRKIGQGLTLWDKIKASAIAKFDRSTDGKMMFAIAGRELCLLKADLSSQTRMVIAPIHISMKPRKRKILDAESTEPLSDGAPSSDDEYYDGESMFGDHIGADAAEDDQPEQTTSRKRSHDEMEPAITYAEDDSDNWIIEKLDGFQPHPQKPEWL